jgi:hypothetical protein
MSSTITYIHKQKSEKSFIIEVVLRRFWVAATSQYNV